MEPEICPLTHETGYRLSSKIKTRSRSGARAPRAETARRTATRPDKRQTFAAGFPRLGETAFGAVFATAGFFAATAFFVAAPSVEEGFATFGAGIKLSSNSARCQCS
jgi:hypothetical protein